MIFGRSLELLEQFENLKTLRLIGLICVGAIVLSLCISQSDTESDQKGKSL